MKIRNTIGLMTLFVASTAALSEAAVLYTLAGPQLVNEANIELPSLGLTRNDSSTGTLYFRFTVTNPASNYLTENYFAGFQFYEGSQERVGIGNAWDMWAYSAFGTQTGNVDLNNPAPPTAPYNMKLVELSDITTILFRVDYNPAGLDNFTVWLNPNLSLTEAEQSASLTTSFNGNASFDRILLREGGGGDGWTFSNIAIANTATSTGFFAVPEPSTALLGALGILSLLHRRKRL